MPQIGWFEILIIVAIAIIVIGPKDFPIMLKKVGSWLGSIKRYINNFQNEVSNFQNETIDDVTKDNNIQKEKKESNDKKSK